MWMLIYPLILLIILFVGVGFSKKGTWNYDFLSLERTKMLQGFCAVAIIFHHLSQRLAETAPQGKATGLDFFTDIGVWFVGIFFFCSGFGLVKSYKTKPDYLNGFFRKRFTVVLIPFYLINIIYIAAELISGRKFDLYAFLMELSGLWLPNGNAWYIVAIAIFYIAFYIFFKKSQSEKTAFLQMGIFLAFYIVISLCLGHGIMWLQGEWWFNTAALFFVGMLVAQNESELVDSIKEKYPAHIFCSLFLLIIFYWLTRYALGTYSYWAESAGGTGIPERFICLSVQLPMVVCFVWAVLILTMKIRIGNVILKFLGKISLELYLIHGLFIEYLRPLFTTKNNIFYVGAVLVCAVVSAFILNFADKKLIGLLKEKKS